MTWSSKIAVVAAGAALALPGSALADETDPMNGMGCVHAAGEGPDSLAAAGPSEAPSSARAPSEAPITAAGAPPPAAQTPASTSEPVSQVTKPATRQVSKPATQVPVQRPATTTTQAAPAEAAASTPVSAQGSAPAKGTVATPTRAEQSRPRKQRAARRSTSRPERTVVVRRFNGLEPRVARPSTAVLEPVVPPARIVPAAPVERTPTGLILAGLLGLAGIAAAVTVARRRRGVGGVIAVEVPDPPAAPAYADAMVEAELHEIIAEERARVLLSGERESPGTR